MVLQNNGQISFSDIATEFGLTNSNLALGGNLSTAANLSTGVEREIADFYGLSSSVPLTSITNINGLPQREEILISQFISSGDALLIPAGFWVWSDSTSVAAITLDIPCTLINEGNIIGRGGNANGGFGGPAINITSTGVSIINNAGAFIAGGGGGGQFVTTNLGRGQSAGGGGGAGGGTGNRGSGNANSSFIAGGTIGQAGGGGAEAGASGGTGNDSAGSGGGRVLPGTAHGVTGGGAGNDGGDAIGTTAAGGGGWGANGGSNSFRYPGGQGGAAIIGDKVWDGQVTGSGTVFGGVAPSVGSELQINDFLNHKEVSLSSLGVTAGQTITIPSDFFFWSDNVSTAGLTIDVNNVTIINNGNIMGKGGRGAAGGSTGEAGGPAINVTATGVSITNNGFIGGGGGGGGGNGSLSRGRFGSGGGGAGGGFGRYGSSNPSGSDDLIAPGQIGGRGSPLFTSSGAEAGGSAGSAGTGTSGGGGRVVPGNGNAGVNASGGGYGANGGSGSSFGGGTGGAGGAAITGNPVSLTNNGNLFGSTP